MSLLAESVAYGDLVAYYEIFSKAEDFPAFVYKFLRNKVQGKVVLDLGCGTGKYAQLLASNCQNYIGIDQSESALAYCHRKIANLKNARLICSDAQFMPLANNSVDIIFSCWMLGTVSATDKRDRIISECQRVLRPSGSFYLIENDFGGEFETVRDKCKEGSQTDLYNKYLYNRNFRVVRNFDSYFKFESLEEARSVFKIIWGESVAEKIGSSVVGHKIVVLKMEEIS